MVRSLLDQGYDQTEPYAAGNGHSHLVFTIEDLEGIVSTLEQAGVEVALQPKTMTVEGHDYHIAFMMDPDGYKVELSERSTIKGGDLIQ